MTRIILRSHLSNEQVLLQAQSLLQWPARSCAVSQVEVPARRTHGMHANVIASNRASSGVLLMSLEQIVFDFASGCWRILNDS